MNLYLIHLGYYELEIGMYELHTNILVAATDVKAAKAAVKSKPMFINKKMHIDGIQEIKNVDGYTVQLAKSDEGGESSRVYGYHDINGL